VHSVEEAENKLKEKWSNLSLNITSKVSQWGNKECTDLAQHLVFELKRCLLFSTRLLLIHPFFLLLAVLVSRRWFRSPSPPSSQLHTHSHTGFLSWFFSCFTPLLNSIPAVFCGALYRHMPSQVISERFQWTYPPKIISLCFLSAIKKKKKNRRE